jgi:hypothetical protein
VIAEPVWAAPILALIQLADAVFCAMPLLPWLKLAAAAGLVAGLWIDYLGALTALGLVLYFTLAVGAHIRVRDFGRNIINATLLLVFSACVLITFL